MLHLKKQQQIAQHDADARPGDHISGVVHPAHHADDRQKGAETEQQAAQRREDIQKGHGEDEGAGHMTAGEGMGVMG